MRVVLCGYYGKGNTGDEALLATLLQMLPERITPIVLSANPGQTESQYGVEARDRNSPVELWRTIAEADGFIWGGGSLIQDTTSFRSPLYYFALMALAQAMGKVTVAWGQGIGPLRFWSTRQMARSLFRGCTAVSVRDRNSARLLDHWQIPYTLAPDPVWALEIPSDRGSEDSSSSQVAVILRPHPLLTSDRLNLLTEALRQFQQATDTHLLLLPFQEQTDFAIAQQLHAELPEVSQIAIGNSPQEYQNMLATVRLAIAMRLHGLIMAAHQGCTCVALSYDPKVTQLMEQLQLPGWELDKLPATATEISQSWIEAYGRGQNLSVEQRQTISTKALEHQHLLHRIFFAPSQS
ncbi:polysaccharide pyruvyl transferase CsaB [Roseofilum casamattae]|uniref:Polysaccharide pyruvyl transferase CsaB n=1 Tax=Roseofilum casamattae BLCC-M143 TaxID=3022442 RepID=A0ABT7BW93_9CYAN|nr:polysaccharide pyruvyl transferase CsaB [Roseofilum casamattae]MDJ1183446.1 polysaccharide pyruvyl transferase CsaB [Roseofilum casamattae BLCC-M143]